jgi:ArsR family transcriptional regulator, arsenate/arsenite/antimonite-responsive transcriptional repressor
MFVKLCECLFKTLGDLVRLRLLREAGLIGCERRGTWVYYWLNPFRLAQRSQLLEVGSMAPA